MSWYSDQLKDPRWQRKRLEIFQRDNFTCRSCKDSKSTLHVHHFVYAKNPWEGEDDEKWTVCQVCHDRIHLFIRIEKEIEDFYVSFEGPTDAFQCLMIASSLMNISKSYMALRKELLSSAQKDAGGAVRVSPGSPEDTCDTKDTPKGREGLQGRSALPLSTPEDATPSTVSPNTGSPVPA